MRDVYAEQRGPRERAAHGVRCTIFYVSARADDAGLQCGLLTAHACACRSSFLKTQAANDFRACDERGAPSDAWMCVYPMRAPNSERGNEARALRACSECVRRQLRQGRRSAVTHSVSSDFPMRYALLRLENRCAARSRQLSAEPILQGAGWRGAALDDRGMKHRDANMRRCERCTGATHSVCRGILHVRFSR